MTLIPLILWLIAAACCIAIIILARHYAGTKEEPKPVAKSAIALHFVSLVLAMAPYVAFITVDSFPKEMLCVVVIWDNHSPAPTYACAFAKMGNIAK